MHLVDAVNDMLPDGLSRSVFQTNVHSRRPRRFAVRKPTTPDLHPRIGIVAACSSPIKCAYLRLRVVRSSGRKIVFGYLSHWNFFPLGRRHRLWLPRPSILRPQHRVGVCIFSGEYSGSLRLCRVSILFVGCGLDGEAMCFVFDCCAVRHLIHAGKRSFICHCCRAPRCKCRTSQKSRNNT